MLKEYLSKIADSIRSVLGTTDPINAQDFPDKIEEVYNAGKAGGIALRNLIVENHGGTGCFLMYTTVENGKVVAKVDYAGRDDNYPGTVYGGGVYQVLAGSLVVLGVYDDWGYLNDESYLEEIYHEMIGELWVYGFMVTAEDGEDCVLDF